jgi:hypothetical protein
MREDVAIPDMVFDQTGYYIKLQEQAMYLQKGDYDSLEKAIDPSEFLQSKNSLLGPMYAQVIGLIKHIKNTPENKIIEEYQNLKNIVTLNEKLTDKGKKDKIAQLKESYALLLEKEREESNDPAHQLDNLHKQCLLLYNLFRIWDGYIDQVKMDDMTQRWLQTIANNAEQVSKEETDTVLGRKEHKDMAPKDDTLEDAQMSAHERHTTDSDAEDDIEKENISAKNRAQGQEDEADVGNTQEQAATATDEIERKFVEMSQNKEKFEQQFEKEFDVADDKTNLMYGLQQMGSRRTIDALDFLKETSLEQLFPKDFIDSIQNFEEPKLIYKDVKTIEEKDHREPSGNSDTLRSSVITEVYKKRLSDLANSEALSRKDKNKINEIRGMLNKIAECRVQEPKMLLRIIEIYTPLYSFE